MLRESSTAGWYVEDVRVALKEIGVGVNMEQV